MLQNGFPLKLHPSSLMFSFLLYRMSPLLTGMPDVPKYVYSLYLLSFISLSFTDWLNSNDLPLQFEMLPAEELSGLLRRFYGEVRKEDGGVYSKSALAGVRAAISRHITTTPWNRGINIIRDREFKQANNLFVGL